VAEKSSNIIFAKKTQLLIHFNPRTHLQHP